jgi:hypothetical protein
VNMYVLAVTWTMLKAAPEEVSAAGRCTAPRYALRVIEESSSSAAVAMPSGSRGLSVIGRGCLQSFRQSIPCKRTSTFLHHSLAITFTTEHGVLRRCAVPGQPAPLAGTFVVRIDRGQQTAVEGDALVPALRGAAVQALSRHVRRCAAPLAVLCLRLDLGLQTEKPLPRRGDDRQDVLHQPDAGHRRCPCAAGDGLSAGRPTPWT